MSVHPPHACDSETRYSRAGTAPFDAARWIYSQVRYNRFLFIALPICAALAFWISYQLRFDFDVPLEWARQCFFLLPYVSIMKLVVFLVMREHQASWRYVGMTEVMHLAAFSAICAAALFAVRPLGPMFTIPRGVIVIDSMMTLILSGGLLIGARFAREHLAGIVTNGRAIRKKNVIIIGAGDAGELILRDMKRSARSPYNPTALFDDDRSKHGLTIHGIRVEGAVDAVRSYAHTTPVDVAVVAIPSANRDQMNRIYTALSTLHIPIKTLPPLFESLEAPGTVNALRDVNITDLLGREEITIDTDQLDDMIRGRVVLVTGAGGSIGSELCRQVAKHGPRALIMVDRSENSLFEIDRQLADRGSAPDAPVLIPLLLDVRDETSVRRYMSEHRPSLVFHAAAHKHVTMQESHACECFVNNVGGLRNMARVSIETGVDRFVLVSTDKAVNPTSVMGATKRVCEMYCQALSDSSSTEFIAVRFGNVLASAGSVVPIFLKQIAAGGPVTVTHPLVARYFMTIPEAVALVLQAAAQGSEGRIMMLDMGTPIKIVDLARQLIALSGKSSDTVQIRFTGLRPGEKLFEELCGDTESAAPTAHPKIRMLIQSTDAHATLACRIDAAVEKTRHGLSDESVIAVLQHLVPEYCPTRLNKTPVRPTGATTELTRAAGLLS